MDFGEEEEVVVVMMVSIQDRRHLIVTVIVQVLKDQDGHQAFGPVLWEVQQLDIEWDEIVNVVRTSEIRLLDLMIPGRAVHVHRRNSQPQQRGQGLAQLDVDKQRQYYFKRGERYDEQKRRMRFLLPIK